MTSKTLSISYPSGGFCNCHLKRGPHLPLTSLQFTMKELKNKFKAKLFK